MSEEARTPRVFLSYSHGDRRWVDRLAVHLRTLAPDLAVWSDASIKPGDSWRKEIDKAIKRADVAILLLSADYLASDFIADLELPVLVDLAQQGKTLILPIVVSPFHMPRDNALWRFQWLNPDKPLSGLQTHEQDEVFREVARVIESRLGSASAKEAREATDNREEPPLGRPSTPKESLAVSAALADEVAQRVVDLLASDRPEAEDSDVPAKAARKRSESSLVFVVMSFKEEMEPIFEGIAAAASSVGLAAKRVKDVPGDYRITEKILEMILSSRLVVADLTHERPNVYFELGYARGLGKTVITVARRDSAIHFDVKDWTYITYTDSRTLERDLRERFTHELER